MNVNTYMKFQLYFFTTARAQLSPAHLPMFPRTVTCKVPVQLSGGGLPAWSQGREGPGFAAAGVIGFSI